MNKWWKRFVVEPLSQTLAEANWFGFVISAIVIAAAVNIATSALVEAIGALGSLITLMVAMAVILLFANAYVVRMRHRIAAAERIIAERSHPGRRQGLVVMVTRAPTAGKALAYHHDTLQHLWMIVTPDMRDEANQLRKQAEGQGVKCHPLDLANEYDASGCYRLVRSVFEVLAGQTGLAPGDVIADMTGGTKPMTAGMVLACTDLKAALEHVPTQFVGAGQPTIPLDPIEVVFGRQ